MSGLDMEMASGVAAFEAKEFARAMQLLLPLAERDLRMGRKESYLPIAVLAAAMVLVALHLVPVAVAFFGAAVLLLLARSLSLREAYDVVDWPILVMLGALIPVSDSLRTTGGTELIAGWLSAAIPSLITWIASASRATAW